MGDASFQAWLKDFLIGGLTGAITKTATAPIERVKLLIQTQDANPLIRSGEVARYTGMGNCFSRVASEQGFASFWNGNTANVIRYFPQQAFNLSFKDTIKKMFPKYDGKKEFAKFLGVNLASAGLGAAGSLTICYPLDFARTRLAADVGATQRQFNGIFDCLKKTAANQGPLAIYNGFGASLAGIVVYRGLQLGMFDSIMGLNPYQKDLGLMGFVSGFIAAQVAGIAARPFNYPFDTVRRRLQMESEKPMEQRLYKGTIHCAVTIVKTEGFLALYKGLVADIIRGGFAAMVPLIYEKIKQALAEKENQK
jgi:solute carrier family 25 (adenine nucleotide translocator) protein 4/5/6/31